MAKKTAPPKDREAVLLRARSLLAEHFDVALCIVSWEDEGETFYMDFKYGNDYAARALCREADEILWPLFGHESGKRQKTHWITSLKQNDRTLATQPAKENPDSK